MASDLDHIRLANHNHDLMLHLLQSGRFGDWATTAAFYKAVHIVEAVFAADMGKHSTSHVDRELTLKIAKVQGDFHRLLTSVDSVSSGAIS